MNEINRQNLDLVEGYFAWPAVPTELLKASQDNINFENIKQENPEEEIVPILQDIQSVLNIKTSNERKIQETSFTSAVSDSIGELNRFGNFETPKGPPSIFDIMRNNDAAMQAKFKPESVLFQGQLAKRQGYGWSNHLWNKEFKKKGKSLDTKAFS